MKKVPIKSTVRQTSPLTDNIKASFAEIIPKRARKYFHAREQQDELRGTKLKVTLDISGRLFSYIIRNGVDFKSKEGHIDDPHLRISLSPESIARLAETEDIDMLTGMQLTPKKYELLSELKGIVVLRLKNPDDNIPEITIVFNNAETPKTVLQLSVQDANLIGSGRKSIFSLLVSGKIEVEGSLLFVMNLQPLFAA